MKNKKKVALVFGVSGQDGAYLAKFLLARKYRVFAVIKTKTEKSYENLEYLGIEKKVKIQTCNIESNKLVRRVIKSVMPDEIYHFAAISHIKQSWDNPGRTFSVNCLGTLNILEAIKGFSQKTKLFHASSGEIFDKQFGSIKKNEKSKILPTNPYGASKAFSHFIVRNYREFFGMFCVNGIFFNHESPLRGQNFVTRKISQGVAKIKLAMEDSIELGNIDSERDWGYAPEYVEAAWKMLQQRTPQDFIISSGKSHSVKDFLEVAFRHVGIKNWKKYIRVNKKFFRPADQHSIIGDNTKAKKILSWQPKMKFEKIVSIMVEADIKRLKSKDI